jgi:hypothetical protein
MFYLLGWLMPTIADLFELRSFSGFIDDFKVFLSYLLDIV